MFDVIVKNGLIVRSSSSSNHQNGVFRPELTKDPQVTATEVLPFGLEIGIQGGKIAAIGRTLQVGPETQIVDAEGAYITPGYVTRHGEGLGPGSSVTNRQIIYVVE
jgi:imidazolonepropionase-like amidohydrolase